jgi:hypothetical protein
MGSYADYFIPRTGVRLFVRALTARLKQWWCMGMNNVWYVNPTFWNVVQVSNVSQI